MPLQDVSNDSSMLDWLQQAGHGHLLNEQHQVSNMSSSQSPPIIAGGQFNSFNHSSAASQANNYNNQSYNPQHSPINFVSSPTQFLAPQINQQQFDADIEHMRRDPNTQVIQRPSQGDVVYKQRVFVRYLQPPTPPVGGAIIVREKQPPPPPPEPPIVIRRAPPPPPTPPPVVIRERPPPIPPPEATTIINRIIPAAPQPARQVIIEQYPPLPPKPQDVIIERWLPAPPRQRRILYERLPPAAVQQTRPVIVQYGQPHVRIHRQVSAVPGAHIPHHQVTTHMDANQILSHIGGGIQQLHTTLSPSSLVSYDPYSSLQQSYGSIGHPQSNIVITQGGQPSSISSSSYGVPLSCVCTPNQTTGLSTYGSGISSVPLVGHSVGQSTVYNVPGDASIDNVLRQLGVDPYSLQHSTGIIQPASHAVTYVTNPHDAVSHVWNAASHAGSSPAGHYLHPQHAGAVQSEGIHVPRSSSPSNYPPSSSYPPPSNYPPSSSYPPPSSYPPSSSYPPPPSNYPPPSSYPPSSSYPPPSGGSNNSGPGVLSRLFGGESR